MKMSYRTHGGKGDKRRESLVEESVIVEEWDRIFESGGKCPECTKYQCVCVEDDIKDEQ
tara:strand:- start:592 stop:768 length:177 start_codon:yes stop_codon:yes gene_type:complete